MNNKELKVSFISQKLKDEFNSLSSGKFEDKNYMISLIVSAVYLIMIRIMIPDIVTGWMVLTQ